MKTKLFITTALVMQTAFCFSQMNVSYSVVAPPGPCDSCVTLQANVTGGTPPYIYEWYRGCMGFISLIDTGQYFAACSGGTLQQGDSLKLLVTDAASQQAGYCERVNSFLPPPSSLTDIDFCIATVDSATNKNLLVWEQSTDPYVVSYNIYKYNTSSQWEVIANVPRTSFSTFIDTSSNPLQTYDTYNLSTVDSCGFGTPWSAGMAIRTILLQVSAGTPPPKWNLTWNWTQGYPIVRYRIWRGFTSGNLTLIDSVSNTIYAYTDLTPPPGWLYYVVEAVSTVVCNPSLKIQNTFSTYSSSLSNVASTGASGINEISAANNFFIYPNPASDKFYADVKNSNKKTEVSLFDVYGRIVIEKIKSNNKQTEIDVSGLREGIYFIQIKTTEGTNTNKIVIQR